MKSFATALLSFWLFAIPLAAQTFVYVYHACPQPCNPAGYVSVFEGTNRITTIPMPSAGFGLTAERHFAATPNGKYMLMTGGAVTVFDIKTSKMVTQITDIPAANSIAITPDSRWAWVGSGFGTIGKIDLLTLKTVAYITRPDYIAGSAYSPYGGLTLNRDGSSIYVVDRYTHFSDKPTISAIDTLTNAIGNNRFIVNPSLSWSDLVVNNDGNLLYNSGAIFNVGGTMNSGYITLFDTSTFAKLAPSLAVNSPGVALSPDGKILYLNSYYPDTDSVYGIDATLKSGLTPIVRIPIPPHFGGYGHLGKLAIDPSGKFAYATNTGGPSYLEVIDLELKSVVSVPLSSAPAYAMSTAYSLGIAGPPAPVVVTIQASTASLSVGEQMQFTASVLNDPNYNAGVIWSLSGPGTITATGLYTAPTSVTAKVIVTITATSVADPTKSASATITLTPPGDIITSDGILNAASMLQGPVAPGEIVNVFGSGFGPTDSVSSSPDDSGFVPTQIAGLRLLFDGIPSPILYADADQVRAVVPYEVGSAPETQVQVEYQGQKSNPVRLPVATVAPGIFTADSSGAGQAMLLNEDETQNSPSNPAPTGSRVVFYATGAGESNPPGVDGQVSQEPFPKPQAPVTVSIAGMDADILSVGAAPGSVAGLIRVCVRVPDNAPASDAVQLEMSVGGVGSQPGVTLAIH